MLVKKLSLSVMLKICLFFAFFEPRDAYKGDAYIKKTCIDAELLTLFVLDG